MKRSKKLYLYNLTAPLLPATRANNIKVKFLRICGVCVGVDVRIVSSARFFLTGKLIISPGVFIGHDALIVGGDAEVSIGENVDIGPRVTLATGSHEITAEAYRVAGPGYSSPIKIGRGCWLGAGSIVLGGSVLGEGSIVAAGAVVKGCFPGGVLIAGVPARVVKKL